MSRGISGSGEGFGVTELYGSPRGTAEAAGCGPHGGILRRRKGLWVLGPEVVEAPWPPVGRTLPQAGPGRSVHRERPFGAHGPPCGGCWLAPAVVLEPHYLWGPRGHRCQPAACWSSRLPWQALGRLSAGCCSLQAISGSRMEYFPHGITISIVAAFPSFSPSMSSPLRPAGSAPPEPELPLSSPPFLRLPY